MKLVYVPVCMQPDALDFTYQDCMSTICDAMIYVNSACQPRPHLTITRCFPTCVIPKEIKFRVICENIDAVNKASPYVIKFVAQIVTLF